MLVLDKRSRRRSMVTILFWALAVSFALGSCSSSCCYCVTALPLLPIALQTVMARSSILVRGGSTTSSPQRPGRTDHHHRDPVVMDTAEERLRRSIMDRYSKTKAAGKFHIQGWRWHTMSVAREAERLQKLALRILQEKQCSGEPWDESELSRLRLAADYVVDFNLKALHRVQDMFFPWVCQRVNDSLGADADLKNSFCEVVQDLKQDQRKLAELGNSITRSLSSYAENPQSVPPQKVAQTVASQSGALVDLTRSMLEREVSLLIPAVGACVPEKEQKKFNNQVIKFLGVLESRCHLVHMHEVVVEANSALEEQLWVESIPSLPRSMIPRWKRTLYEPKAGMLNP